MSAAGITGVLSAAEREQLRHPRERIVAWVVLALDALVFAAILGVLLWGTEWFERYPMLDKYKGYARLLLLAVAGAPILATWANRRRQIVAKEESIRVGPAQLPELHRVLEAHCRRMGIPEPSLYLSDSLEYTTSFSMRGRHCIIIATREFSRFPEAFEDIVTFVLAREVGSICLGYTSFRNDMLTSYVAPIPFLRGPLSRVQTYSRDRFGALLAPRALRALIVAASGDRLRDRVDIDAYFAQLDEATNLGFLARLAHIASPRVSLAFRVQELRRAGLMTRC